MRRDDDFTREIEAHIALETDRLIAEGMSPAAAEDHARRRFGNVAQARERFYESRRVMWLEHVRQDVRDALRTLQQSPGFALVAVATLALGIGATTMVATGINAVFYQPPPVGAPHDLRTLAWTSPRRAFTGNLFRGTTFDTRRIESFPVDVCHAVQQRIAAWASIACWRVATEALTDTGLIRVHAVSGTYFATLGVRPLMGRAIAVSDDDPAAPLVAMARDPELLDRTIRIHSEVFTVVGIVPADFSGLAPMAPADVFVPYAADARFPTFQRNAWSESNIVGRLAPGVSPEAVRAETEVLVHQLIQAAPVKDAYDLPALFLQELSSRLEVVQHTMSRPLRLLAATVAILLTLTCANVGGLFFARGRARHKELATRLALGGPRRRVVQQLLTESLLLSAAGGILGIGVALALAPLLPRLLSDLGNTTALGLELRPNLQVLAVTALVTIACGLLSGWVPALSATRLDPAHALRQASGIVPPSRMRAGKAALTVQLALSLIVLVAAGLLARTMMNLRAVPLGYHPEGLIFVETSNPVGRPRAVVDETLAALQALPGVASATVSQWPIFNNALPRFPICVPDVLTAQSIDYSFVFPGFFDTWGVRFIAGRDIDDTTAPQVVVNETFVRQYLHGRNPLESSISFGTQGCPGRMAVPVVGVVADHIDRQRVEVIPSVYARYPRAGALYVTTYAVRAAGDEQALMPAMRRLIADRGIAPNRDVRRATEYRDSVMRQERLLAWLLAFFAVVALFIACLGIYGILAYAVNWRTPELGVRMALGAEPGRLRRMVLRESLLPVVTGLALGSAGTLILGKSVEGVLFGVQAGDPLTLALAAALLTIAALLASWLPARRATRLDPLLALK
jgi:predicted permease